MAWIAGAAACSEDRGQVAIGDAVGADVREVASDSGGDEGVGFDATMTGDTPAGEADQGPTTDASIGDTTVAPDLFDGSGTGDAGDVGPEQVCPPNASTCANLDSLMRCNASGTAFGDPEPCGPETTCRNGQCLAKCPNNPKFGVYVGCEFWATDLPNYPDAFVNPTPENSPWAVVVSNPGPQAVTVSFEMPPFYPYAPPDPVVPPNEARVFELPKINVQGTSLLPKGVHVSATGPVTVHQFNPFDMRFSNDASLLMPDPLLGKEYAILSWPTSPLDLFVIPDLPTPPNQNGYLVIIAAYDGTDVEVTPSAHVRASGAIPELEPGQVYKVRLNRADVLSIQADPRTLLEGADITGSVVKANRPIAVFGGHEEAVIGDPVPAGDGSTKSPCCADHLEEQMLSVDLAGTRYLAVHSPPRGTGVIENDWWRIQALEPGVTVTTNPPQSGANGVTLAKVGDWLELKSAASFEVTATGKVQVGQYLASRDTTEDFTGDASLVVLVPADRFRKDYVFMTPDYTVATIFGSTPPKLWATVIKPSGAVVTIDGATVPEADFTPLGSTGFAYAHVAVDADVHEASSAEKFGLLVYGYNSAVSFSYIGGLAGPGE